jgi:integrase
VSRGLARGTIKHAFDVFRRVLDVAVQDGAIPANPAAAVPLPRRNATVDVEPFAPHPLTGEQVAAVAAHIGSRHEVYGLVGARAVLPSRPPPR